MRLFHNKHLHIAVGINSLVIVLIIGFIVGWFGKGISNRITTANDDGEVAVNATNNSEEQPTDALDTKSNNEKLDAKPQSLQGELNEAIVKWSQNTPGEHAVFVQGFESNQPAVLNATQPMVAASTYKLFLVYVTLSHQQQGLIALDDQLPGGQSVAACIESLLVQSSDDCAYRLGDVIGWSAIDLFLYSSGFVDTAINNYDDNGNFVGDKISTAADEARLLTRLYKGTLLNKANTDFMLAFMKRQIHTQRIRAGVPGEVEVASKPGFIVSEKIENDTAIVYAKKPYVLVVMTKDASAASIADLAQQLHAIIQ